MTADLFSVPKTTFASLKGTTFGGKAVYPIRGSGDSLVFDDETELKEFGLLSDERKHH